MLSMQPGTRALVWNMNPWASFTVDYWGQIVKKTSGWGGGYCYGMVSKAAPAQPIALPVVAYHERVIPRDFDEHADVVKGDDPEQQFIWPAKSSQPAVYTVEVDIPQKLLALVGGGDNMLLRMRCKVHAEKGSLTTDPAPDVTIDLGAWVQTTTLNAVKIVRQPGSSVVWTALLSTLAQLTPSAKLAITWKWSDLTTYNAVFSVQLEIDGYTYGAFFDADLIPRLSEYLEDASDASSSEESSV